MYKSNFFLLGWGIPNGAYSILIHAITSISSLHSGTCLSVSLISLSLLDHSRHHTHASAFRVIKQILTLVSSSQLPIAYSWRISEFTSLPSIFFSILSVLSSFLTITLFSWLSKTLKVNNKSLYFIIRVGHGLSAAVA